MKPAIQEYSGLLVILLMMIVVTEEGLFRYPGASFVLNPL